MSLDSLLKSDAFPFSSDPLVVARWMLFLSGVRLSVHYSDRQPAHQHVLLVSNHRSFLDAPALMAALGHPVRFACHHYLGQVPVLSDIVRSLGCFPLPAPQRQGMSFFQQATAYLQQQQTVGIFPEGAVPMIEPTPRHRVAEFNRGFAHLALRLPIEDLVILPVAIASHRERCERVIPLKLLQLFDPSEPLFDQAGWHPAILYERVSVILGRPITITDRQREHYHGRRAGQLAAEIAETCHDEVTTLLRQGCY
ncbi:MAG: lysophospholipid acyltransferase family protein [Cyanobacteria bacterium J06648_16]